MTSAPRYGYGPTLIICFSRTYPAVIYSGGGERERGERKGGRDRERDGEEKGERWGRKKRGVRGERKRVKGREKWGRLDAGCSVREGWGRGLICK